MKKKQKQIVSGIVIVAIIAIIILIETTVSSQYGEKVNSEITNQNNDARIQEKAAKYPRANELVEPDGFINSEAFTLQEHIGKKVILVDFWTYSCINCQRTLPYLNAWWEKYEDDGLLIVGIHTPEFAFEKKYENVVDATKKYDVNYPVVLDNEFKTWRAYQNRYWPRKYIIDIDGFIVYDHIGEGAYEETEKVIQDLLKERQTVLNEQVRVEESMSNPDAMVPSRGIRTPEIYFGYGFDRGQLGNEEGRSPEKTVTYVFPEDKEPNTYYVEGDWFNGNDGMTAQNDGKVFLDFQAKQVNIVAGAEAEGTIKVYLNDALQKTLMIKEHDLYTVLDLDKPQRGELVLEVSQGVEIFTFTFG